MWDETRRAPDAPDAPEAPTTERAESTTSIEPEAKRQMLRGVFETQGEELLNGLAVLIHKFGTAKGDARYQHSVREFSRDALSELYLEAMNCAAKFDTQREALPWLFGLGKNICLRQRDRHFRAGKRAQSREQSWSDLPRGEDESLTDAVERLTQHAAHALHSPLEAKHSLHGLLAPLNDSERDIVARFVMQKLDSHTVAEQLGCTPVAARKRLQRALDKLRASDATQTQKLKPLAQKASSQHDTFARESKSEVVADA